MDIDAELDARHFALYEAAERLLDAAAALGRDAEAVKRLVDNVLANRALPAPDDLDSLFGEDPAEARRIAAVQLAMTAVLVDRHA